MTEAMGGQDDRAHPTACLGGPRTRRREIRRRAGRGRAPERSVNARDRELPLPAAAYVMSPYADLTLTGTTMETRRVVDPLLSRELLQPRVTDYVSGQDAASGLIALYSPT